MRAIIAQEGQLKFIETEKPVPQTGELLVKVEAIGVNRTDIINRKRSSAYLDNPILGVEVAGVVEAGDKSLIGTRVMGLVNGGGYAEYVLMPQKRAMIIPQSLSFVEAAGIPEVFLTAYQTLYWIGRLQHQETVLIHAGASGVGTAAIQLAKKLSQARVVVTASSEEKLLFCKELGADVLINYKQQDFAQEVLALTGGVDVILDFVGASYWSKNLASMKIDGRWVLIGTLGGNIVEELNIHDLMSKRIQLTGTLLTPRSDEYKANLTQDFYAMTQKLFNDGTLKPVIDSVFAFDDAARAQRHMESNQNIGKIILKV